MAAEDRCLREGLALSGRVASGSVISKELSDGTMSYELRFRARGRRESVTLHERPGCACGCGGVRVPKPQRSFLELDELRALMDAATAQDPASLRVRPLPGAGETARHVAEMLSRGMGQEAIAEALGRAKATVNWHARRLSADGRHYGGRAFVVRVLGYSGVRNSELCDLRIRHVRLHDAGGARFHIPDAKTETGVRVVEMSPDLAEAFVEHLDRQRRAGKPTDPDDYVVQNLRGGRISRQRIAAIVREAANRPDAAAMASEHDEDE